MPDMCKRTLNSTVTTFIYAFTFTVKVLLPVFFVTRKCVSTDFKWLGHVVYEYESNHIKCRPK